MVIKMYFRIKRLFSIYVACHAKTSDLGILTKLRLMPAFLVAGLRALPHALRWMRVRDPAARARVKQILDLSGPAPIAMNPDILGESAAAGIPANASVTIVMPVYDNLVMAQEALRRVVVHTDIAWRLVIVDDASPSPDVRPALEEFAQANSAQVDLIVLEANQGFVGAANAGLAAAAKWNDPVVLLNTDAFVPAGWASRLLASIWADPSVATVTPMSNDAELGCVPMLSVPQDISAELADRVDQYARKLNAKHLRVTAPAGVGFCMAMAPAFLSKVPQFDTIFAPGYGEEVDWCQTVAAQGGVHVYATNVFVAHMGGQSFGSEAKARLIARNSEVLSRRYPRFDASVFGFTRNDPLVTARLALGIAWAVENQRDAPIAVFMGHSMGGGAEIDLRRRLMAQVEARGAAVVVRLGGVFRFTVELWWRGVDAPVSAGTHDWAHVERLLQPIQNRCVIYSNAVGDLDPFEVPSYIQSLCDASETDLTVLVHDYAIVSPSETLLGQGDRFVWPLDPDDARHQSSRADGAPVSLAQWQAAWSLVLMQASQVVCFSDASARIVRATYRDVTTIVCEPHTLPVDVPVLDGGTGGPTIGVLGNLSPHKGAAIVQCLSTLLKKDPRAKLVVLGNLDPGYRLAAGTVMHGTYAVEDLPDLVQRYAITCWLIPSIWPETFSFTTHEAIATRLPVLTFNIGAQGDAVTASLARGGAGAILGFHDGTLETAQAIVGAGVAAS